MVQVSSEEAERGVLRVPLVCLTITLNFKYSSSFLVKAIAFHLEK